MKNLYIILILLFIVRVQAQDTDLILNTWYLQNVIIEGNDNFPPSNSEVSTITANFYMTEFFSAVCDALSGTITYNDDNNTFILNAGVTFIGCSIQDSTDFQLLYLENFYFNNMDNPFSYSIEETSNVNKTLTVTNILGNQAIYTSEVLTVQEFTNSSIKIYPNPVNSILSVYNNTIFENLKITTFDLFGKKVLPTSFNSIDMNGLNSGLYIILIEDQNGELVTKKIIKD